MEETWTPAACSICGAVDLDELPPDKVKAGAFPGGYVERYFRVLTLGDAEFCQFCADLSIPARRWIEETRRQMWVEACRYCRPEEPTDAWGDE